MSRIYAPNRISQQIDTREDRWAMKYVLPLEAASLGALSEVGGKNASLGEMIRSLKEPVCGCPAGSH